MNLNELRNKVVKGPWKKLSSIMFNILSEIYLLSRMINTSMITSNKCCAKV